MDGQDPTDRITRTIAALRQQGATEQDIETYLTEHEGLKPSAGDAPHSKFTAAQLVGRANRQVTNAQEEATAAAEADNTPASRALGTVASLATDIPGAEAAQAGVRSLVRRQPYTEALADIRGAEATAPAYTRIPARIAGATIANMALPKGLSLTGRGTLYGFLRGAGAADPMTTGERATNAAVQGVAGGALGRAAGLVGAGASRLYPSAGNDARALIGAVRGLLPKAAPPAPLTESAIESVMRPVAANAPSALEAAAADAAPAGEATGGTMSKAAAKSALGRLLQQKLDEGAIGETVKGYPISGDPPTNWALMEQVENALLKAKGAGARAPSVARLRALADANP